MFTVCMLTLTTCTHLMFNYPQNNCKPITNAIHSIKTLNYCVYLSIYFMKSFQEMLEVY